MGEELKPCPFTGEPREVRFDDTTTWTGQRSQHVCTNMIVFCAKDESDPFADITVKIRGRNKEDCIAHWNARHEPARLQVKGLPCPDTLAQIIRKVDGSNNLGAGELAERILSALPPAPEKEG